MQQHQRLLIQLEGAVIAAFAMALEYVPHAFGPSSIEVSLGIIPLVIYSLRRGAIPGMISATVWGTLDLVLRGLGNGSVLNVWQGLFEFTIAFTVVGFAGFFANQLRQSYLLGHKKTSLVYLWLAAFIGAFAKYFCHFIAGAIYWGSYAPKGMNAWIYSLVVNGGSFVLGFIMTGVVLTIIFGVVPHLFVPTTAQKTVH